MPTSCRSARRSSAGSLTRCPHTTISPLSIVSKRSMQRSAVLLPDPLRPITASTSPRSTVKSTPSSTFSLPKLLCTFLSETTGELVGSACILRMSCSLDDGAHRAAARLQPAADTRDRVAKGKVDHGDDRVDEEWLKERVVDDLSRAREFDETDHGGERRVLDDLHHEPYR